MSKKYIYLFLIIPLVLIDIFLINKSIEFSNIYPFKRVLFENDLLFKTDFVKEILPLRSVVLTIENETINSSNEGEELPELIKTGQPSAWTWKDFYHLSTYDLLICSVLGVIGGFLTASLKIDFLIKVWYPFEGGTQLLSGKYIL